MKQLFSSEGVYPIQLTPNYMAKKIIIVLALIVAFICLAAIGMRMYTKSFSPIDIAKYQDDHHQIAVTYCRPYKKERNVYPDLIPFDKVWRTGANDATVITTAQDLAIDDEILPKGTYSMWTIPGKEQWQIIFNSEYGQWGVTALTGEANRDPSLDILSITVPVYQTDNDIEQFTIQFETWGEGIEMLMMWDHTIVVVPIKK
jgi:hypothetical protein